MLDLGARGSGQRELEGALQRGDLLVEGVIAIAHGASAGLRATEHTLPASGEGARMGAAQYKTCARPALEVPGNEWALCCSEYSTVKHRLTSPEALENGYAVG